MGWIVDGTPSLEAKSNYRTVVSLCIVSSAVMMIVLSLRFYIRRSRIALDDGIVAFGGALSIVFSSFVIIQTKYGLGLPKAERPKADLDIYSLYNYAGRPFLWISLTCFKIGLCITYLRMIDRTTRRGYRITIYVFMTLLMCICIIGTGFNLFNCSPMRKNVHPLIKGHCLPYAPYNLATWTINIILDVAVFLLPVPLFMGMSIDLRLKLELSILFSLSLVTTCLSIWKLTQVPRIAYGDGNSTTFVVLSALEANIGLIVSCLPHLKPLYTNTRLFLRTGGSSSTAKNHSYGILDPKSSTNKTFTNSRTTDSISKPAGVVFGSARHTRNDSQDFILSKETRTSHGPGIGKDASSGNNESIELEEGNGIVKTTSIWVGSSEALPTEEGQGERGFESRSWGV